MRSACNLVITFLENSLMQVMIQQLQLSNEDTIWPILETFSLSLSLEAS